MSRLMVDREGLMAALDFGYCWADIKGREGRAKVVGTHGEDYALVKESNGRATLMHVSMIVDLHMDEVAA